MKLLISTSAAILIGTSAFAGVTADQSLSPQYVTGTDAPLAAKSGDDGTFTAGGWGRPGNDSR